jgi:hypothetical protein
VVEPVDKVPLPRVHTGGTACATLESTTWWRVGQAVSPAEDVGHGLLRAC